MIPQQREVQRKRGANGFVERIQGTVLHEHWRVEFRRRYFTQLPQLQRSLDGFLRVYNHEQPHHGHRTRGQTPAALYPRTKNMKSRARSEKLSTPMRNWTG
jgi:hypothetical protein